MTLLEILSGGSAGIHPANEGKGGEGQREAPYKSESYADSGKRGPKITGRLCTAGVTVGSVTQCGQFTAVREGLQLLPGC